jgi:hypothetical protein
MITEAECLRSPDQMFGPDSRTLGFARIDSESGAPRPITTIDQYAAVACFQLNQTVPESVKIHFETAKNLYLYAWCVFRFYPVAEQQVFSALELALRERQPDFVRQYIERHPRSFEPGLGALLNSAIKNGLLRNEIFPGRARWAQARARSRYRYEQMEKMFSEGKPEMVLDDSSVAASEDDLNHDWLRDFLEAIPFIRNQYAHGSEMLHHTVLHTFDVVTQIINQLYPKADKN